MSEQAITTIEVDRRHLESTRLWPENAQTVQAELNEGEVLLRVDGFALTSNNITYAVFGDGLRYWDFFPAHNTGDQLWGRIPVWGFADVVASQCTGVNGGDRVYGYLPMSSHLVVQPGRIDERGWTDMAPHRSAMASAYNRYVLTTSDPMYRTDREAEQMILWPLFMTSFMIDDHVATSGLMSGSGTALISSASSKTAIGTAHLLSRRPNTKVIGLTSVANKEFVQSLGCYHQVMTYDGLDEQLRDLMTSDATLESIAYVDIAGNQTVTRALHTVFGDQLNQSLIVGGTHWDATADISAGSDVPGPTPEFFFAPTSIAQRTKDWGREEFDARMGSAWEAWVEWCGSWMIIDQALGAEAVLAAYQNLLAGRSNPRHGLVARI